MAVAGDSDKIRQSFTPDAVEAFEGQKVKFPKMPMWVESCSGPFPGVLTTAPIHTGHVPLQGPQTE